MIALRCTQKLLTRLKAKPGLDGTVATTVLGHWYANLIYIGRQQLILCVSERSFLPVLLTAKDTATFPSRLFSGVGWLLSRIGVPEFALDHELREMQDFVIGRTQSRQVLGVMNEMAFCLSVVRDRYVDVPLEEPTLYLADTIYGPIGYKSPIEVTRQLFGLSGRDTAAHHN